MHCFLKCLCKLDPARKSVNNAVTSPFANGSIAFNFEAPLKLVIRHVAIKKIIKPG